ncbi:response regulator [Sorangium atrum]|uniref:Response regulator n=1 Tax=Sorangium atrum TaxID=2995308 RepID=A0ABT5C9Z2_9BACT|nr:response regulator [Sorangium aterium]MDC0683195.1 response regulator [Sorangium aterium]
MTQDANKKPLGRILLQQRAVTQPQLEQALLDARAKGVPLATNLIESGTVSEVAALKALSEQSGVPGIDLNQVCIKLSDLSILPREIAAKHKLLPVLVREDRILVAMAAPADKKVIDELEFVTGKRVFPYIALAGPLVRTIAAAYDMKEQGEPFYVGAKCPPEVLKRAGLGSTTSSASEAPPAPPPAPAQPAQPAQPAPRRPASAVPPATAAQAPVAQAPAAPAPSAAPPPPRSAPERPRDDAEISFADLTDEPSPPAATSPARLSSAGPPLVVDDAMRRAAAADELTDTDFGTADRDLSVVESLPGAGKAPQGDQTTILVVDDEPEIRKLLRRIFEERGYRVEEADRGLLALRMVKENPPDVMILDAMLPEVHGFDIARRMKGTQRYGHIPIIMISAVYRGWRFAEDLKSSYGVEAYIEKPFRVADVVAAVENALQARSIRGDQDRISAEAERLLAAGIAAYRAGDFDKAVRHLREGTAIDPLAYRLHFHLGLLYGKQGQLYDAIQELETALHINGKHFPALKNLAVLYQKAGFRNKAIETWERALGVAPDDPTRQSIKEHLLGLL